MANRLTLVLLLGVFLLGCSSDKSVSEHDARVWDYLIRYDGSGWLKTVYINDNPVLWNQKGGCIRRISKAIVNGENTFSFKAVKENVRLTHFPLALQLIEVRKEGDAFNEKCLIDLPADNDELTGVYERNITFTATVPLKWSWEATDTIDPLSQDDREAILSVIRAIRESLEKRDFAAYDDLMTIVVKDSATYAGISEEASFKEEHERVGRWLEGINSVEMRGENELEWVIGKHIVFVQGMGDPWVIRLMGKENVGFQALDAFWFAKINGKWVIVG